MPEKFKEISTKELQSKLNDPNISIIDVRSVDAYNGWRLNDETRGGHIQGARSLPVKWTKYIDWIEIVRSKGILPGQPVIIYGNNPDEAKLVAKMFLRVGYNNIKLYNHFVDEWSADARLPMDQLAKYKQLVYPEWVKSLISGEKHRNLAGIIL